MTDSERGIETSGVLKRDAAGRVHATVEQRQAALAEFERSGLSGPQFARVAGIAYQTFASWRHKQKKGDGAERSRPAVVRQRVEPVVPRLVEALVQYPKADATSCAALVVRLDGGASLEITLAAQVPLAAKLIQALARSC